MSYALAVQVQPRSVNQTPLPSGAFATDHASSDPTWSDDESHEVAFTAGNPRVEHITGVVHLYRDSPSSAQDSLTGFPLLQVPEERGDRLAVLAIPSDMGVADFCQFLGGYLAGVRQMRLVRRGDTPALCLVLLRFKDSAMAAGFYGDYNGRPFSSLEPEVICRLVYVKDVQVTAARDGDIQPAPPPQPSPGQIELPTCPVCLDRLDEETSGLVTTVCNHRFHSECLGKWGDASCPVCRYCQETSAAASRCQVCESSSDLWICLICGHVGCGRYHSKHAVDHWKETTHCYALELQTQRVWDYAADGYVHRLVQSKTDGKLVEVGAPPAAALDGASCSAGAPALEPGVEDALVASKLDALAGEYSALLAGQLESQRTWYDGRQAKAIAEAEASRAEAVASAERGEAAAEGARTAAKDAERAKRTAERKLVEATVKLKAVRKESEALEAMNSQLLANQASLKASLVTAQTTSAERAAQIVDLNEQVRDLMMYFEAQRVVEASGGESCLSNGTVLPMPQQVPEAGGKRRAPRKSR